MTSSEGPQSSERTSKSPAPQGNLSPTRQVTIALAGNPNSGKTSLFNALTGLRYKVANYPGVTVEKKEGAFPLPNFPGASLVDLPGAYSLDSHAIDERIATDVLLGEGDRSSAPDLVVAVVDSTNLERNLFFASQLLDAGLPVIVALSLSDLAELQGISIKTELLSRALGVPVVSVCAKAKRGIDSLRAEINSALQKAQTPKPRQWLPAGDPLETAALDLAVLLSPDAAGTQGVEAHRNVLFALGMISEARPLANPALSQKLSLIQDQLRSLGTDPTSAEATKRYAWIRSLVSQTTVFRDTPHRRWNDRIDAVLTHKIWGLLIFAAIMTLMFQCIFLGAIAPMEAIDEGVSWIGTVVANLLPEGELSSLLVNGVIAGVGSVLVFIPQIAILFFFIGVLEDSGYLSRAAYVTDRVMRKVGLQGRSFVPLLSSFACAIPGIMSTRTIPTRADRLATILIAPLMSCSARLPVYSVLIAAFIPSRRVWGIFSLQGLVILALYLLGIVGASLVALVLKKTLLAGEPSPFVMEMPQFRRPCLSLVLRNVLDRILLFVKNAGTVILACSIILWFLASHPSGSSVKESYAGQIGHLMAPLLKPLGLDWEIGIGILASFAAREIFVSSMATVYNLDAASSSGTSVLSVFRDQHLNGTFSVASALGLLVFYVFACMCTSTLAVCRRETGSWRWTAFMFTYMTTLAYVLAFLTYRIALYWSV